MSLILDKLRKIFIKMGIKKNRVDKISYGKQSINKNDIKAVINVLESDYLTTGPMVEVFEKALQEYTGHNPVVAVSSGTAALHCVYKSINAFEGAEIISTPMTFSATQATALLSNLKVKFADIEIDTGNIDPQKIESQITNKTVAVVVVDFAGNPAKLDDIRSICDKYGLLMIEDAAHSFGSKYKGEYIGSQADLTTFSFYPTKNITTGEGGAIVGKDLDFINKIKHFARQGITREKSRFIYKEEGDWHQEIHVPSLNYRMSDIQAALGLSQLSRVEEFKEKKKKIFDRYSNNLKSVDEISLPKAELNTDPFWHLYSLKVPSNLRKDLYNYLHLNNIKAQVNYFPVHLQPFIKDKHNFNLPVSEKFYAQQISIPFYTELKNSEIDFISEKVINFFEKN